MLRKLTLSTYERDYPDDHAALSALIAFSELAAPLALPAHKSSQSQLHILQAAVTGKDSA